MSELVFRKLSRNDTENIFKACKGNVAKYFYEFKTLDQVNGWVTDAILKQEEGSKIEYVVYDRGEFIGMISPRYLDSDTVDIGLWVSVDYQGRGYAKLMLEMLLLKLKKEDVKEVVYETDVGNKVSAKLAQSAGFQLVNDSGALVFKLSLG